MNTKFRTLLSLLAILTTTYKLVYANNNQSSSISNDIVQLPAFEVTEKLANPFLAVDSSSASRVRTSIMDTPGSISVLTPEFLSEVEPSRIYDATQYTAGVSEGRGDGFNDRQMIRGFENLLRSVDGFSSIQGENVDPLMIDRVEVLKGPSAIINPMGAPGGVISVVTKVPLYQTKNYISLNLGLIDAQRLDLDMTSPFSPGSKFAYRILVGLQDGQLAAAGAKDKKQIFGGSLSYKISDTTKLILRGSIENRKVLVYLPVFIDSSSVNGGDAVLAKGFQYGNNLNGTETWAHRGGQYSTADLLLTSTYGDHLSTRLASKAQYNLQRDQYMAATTPSLSNRYNPYTGQQTPDQIWSLNSTSGTYISTTSPLFDVTNIQRTPYLPRGHTADFNSQFDIAATYEFSGVTSKTVAGIVADHQYSYSIQYIGPNLPFNLLNPVYGAEPVFNTISTKSIGHATSLQDYVNQQFGFFGDHLLISAAAVHVADTAYSLNVISNVSTTLNDSKGISIFGVVLKPTKDISIYASRSSNAVPTIANNMPLWQQGQQYEFGVKLHFFNDRLLFTAAHFQIAQTNVNVPNPAYQSDPTQPQSLLSNIKDHGYEFELFGGLTKNISIAASLTNLYERDALNRLVRAVSPQNAALLLDYKFSGAELKGFSVFAGATYTGRRSGEAPAASFTVLRVVEQPSFFLPAAQLFNLGGRYSIGKWTYALKIDNAFNKHFIEIPTARTNAGLALPRNVRLTATLTF